MVKTHSIACAKWRKHTPRGDSTALTGRLIRFVQTSNVMEKLYGKNGTAPEVDASKAGSLKIEMLMGLFSENRNL